LLFVAGAADFLSDAVFALARFDGLAADILLVAAACVAPRLAVVFPPDLPAADEAAALVATRLAVLVFPLAAARLDLDDFLRVFLDIRLPFVAFGRVFWESREPRRSTKANFFGWANLTSPEYGG
jgi:hypothetical protein